MASMVAECSRVDPGARVAEDTIIGPGCVIGPDVEIGRGTELVGHVCLLGAVRIGEFNKIGPFVAIGGEPQDLSYWGTATRVEIGDYNEIRRAGDHPPGLREGRRHHSYRQPQSLSQQLAHCP